MRYLGSVDKVFPGHADARNHIPHFHESVQNDRPVKVTFSRLFPRSFAPVMAGAAISQRTVFGAGTPTMALHTEHRSLVLFHAPILLAE